jgi:hypothetical protein
VGVEPPRCEMINNPRITLLGSQHNKLVQYLESHPEGHERAAVVLFRRIHVHVNDLENSDRYLAVEIIPFETDWLVGDSRSHVAFNLTPLRELFRRCEEDNLVFGFVHNHPTGYPDFSETDDVNESTLLSALRNRNGLNISFVSLLWTNGQWKARVRHASDVTRVVEIRHVAVFSEKLSLYSYRVTQQGSEDILAKQAAAFGKPFVDMLRSLRIGIVGAGGTGSALSTLLARAGIGELILIDDDRLEDTNLNRVRGAAKKDVSRHKAEILRDYIRNLDLSVKVAAITSAVDTDPLAVDAIASCDVVFGCTDDQIGRELINTALYAYSLACIDLGLGGRIDEDRHGHPILRHHFARISTILPEYGECLFCQDVIRQEWIQHQYALRDNPNMSEEEAKEKYLAGGGEAAPGVAPFTGAAADFAVANLFDLIRPFRRLPGNVRKDLYNIDFINMEICSRQKRSDNACPYCQQKSFLLLKEKSRLNRPILGKRDESH